MLLIVVFLVKLLVLQNCVRIQYAQMIIRGSLNVLVGIPYMLNFFRDYILRSRCREIFVALIFEMRGVAHSQTFSDQIFAGFMRTDLQNT